MTEISDFRPQAQASSASNPAEWLVDWVRGGTESDSGIAVNSASILTSGPVWQAVNVISGDLGQLPLILYKRTADNRKTRDTSHPAARLVRRRPNAEMRINTFKELMQSRALLWGNAVAAIMRDRGGRPIDLIPLPPDRTSVERDDNGVLWYLTSTAMGKTKFRPADVFHISGLTSDGIWGHSVISLAKNTIGKDLALEKHGNRTFKNAARPSGALEIPQRLTPEARRNLREEWNSMHEGLDNVNRIAVLQEGAHFSAMSVPNEDAQWLDSMKHSPVQVAHWFLLPPHKVNSLERATFSNIESQQQDYFNTCLMRWLVKWQEECEAKLLTEREADSGQHFFRWNTGALLRGDLKTRYEAYSLGRAGAWLSVNDVRNSEDLNEIEGGDDYENPNITSGDGARAGVFTPQTAGDQHLGAQGCLLPDASVVRDGDPLAEEPSGLEASDGGEMVARVAHERLIADRCSYLLTVEKQNVERAAKRGGDFVGWLDSYYERFPATISTVLKHSLEAAGSIGMETADLENFATSYAAASKDVFLEVAGTVTELRLEEAISSELEGWANNAANIAERLTDEHL